MNKLKIRTKIMIWYTTLSIILLAILIPVIYVTVAGSLRQTFHEKIESSMSQAASAIEEKNGVLYMNTNDLNIENDIYLLITSENGTILYNSKNCAWLKTVTFSNNEKTMTHGGTNWLVLKRTYTAQNQTVTVVATSSTKYIDSPLNDLEFSFLFIVPVYLLISAFGALILAKRAMKPIHTITKTAGTIGEGDLTQRIEQIETNDEVGELASTLNRMLDDLEISFKRERQFTSDASHELRTPITIINACCEDTLAYDLPAESKENFEAIKEETEKMTHIISQLLMLSRGYEGRYHLEFDRINLFCMIQLIKEELEDLTMSKDIVVHNDVPADFEINADQSLMTQLFVNLLENATKYGAEHGSIWISAKNTNQKQIKIIVSDDGIGISTADMPHIFERFYRADKARDRSGSGLGLAIVKWIVDLHGGNIVAKSNAHQGTAFEINLPKEHFLA